MMKRILGSFFVLILLYLLQTTILNGIAIAGVKPNVIILIIVLIGYRYGKIPGILIGFFTGLLLDMTEGTYLGYFALIYMLLGYFVGFSHRIYHRDFNVIPLVLIGLSDLTLNLMFYISGFLLRNRLDFFYYLFRIILPELIYTMVVSVFIYKLLHLLFGFLDKKKEEVKEEAKEVV